MRTNLLRASLQVSEVEGQLPPSNSEGLRLPLTLSLPKTPHRFSVLVCKITELQKLASPFLSVSPTVHSSDAPFPAGTQDFAGPSFPAPTGLSWPLSCPVLRPGY